MFDQYLNTPPFHSLLVICMLLSSPAWAQDAFSRLPDPTRPDLGFGKPADESTGSLIGDLIGDLIGNSSKDPETKAPPELVLQYTQISTKRRLAVINGKTIAEGESIADAQIMEVRAEQVVARRQGKQIILDLARYQTKVKEPEPGTEQAAGGNNDAPK